MRRLIFYIVALTFLALKSTGAQSGSQTESLTVLNSGNLLRIPFDAVQINTADTTGKWYDNYYESKWEAYNKYAGHISVPGKSYFLKKYESRDLSSYPFGFYSGGQYLAEDNSGTGREIAHMPGPSWDVPVPYMLSSTLVEETKNGRWLINGAFGNAFHFNNDSLLYLSPYTHYHSGRTLSQRIKSIIGKVNDKYLAAFDRPEHGYHEYYDYFLTGLDDSPHIDSLKVIRVRFMGDSTFVTEPHGGLYLNAPFRIGHIKDDLYAMQPDNGHGLSLYRFSDTTFYYLKRVLEDEVYSGFHSHTAWEIRNGKLFILKHTDLISYDFRSSDTSFVNRKVLLGDLKYHESIGLYTMDDNFGFDRNFRYAVKIFKGPETDLKDTLRIFSLDEGKFINSIVLDGVRGPFLPVVDSPYVYIHQIKYHLTSGVSENNGQSVETYKLSAYPNPFNASVKILYSLPANGNVEISIYDLLGRRVETLVRGYETKGEHHVTFNAPNLASGIYLYTLKAGEHMQTKKLVLMK